MTAGRIACQPQLLSPNNFVATQLAISTDSVYVTDYDPANLITSVVRYSKATGTGTVLPIVNSSLWSIATDSQFLYWTNQPADPTQGFVNRSNLDGTGITTIATNQPGASWMLVDSSGAYWVNGLAVNGASDSAIMRLGPGDVSPFTLVAMQLRIGAIASDANNVYWFTTSVQPDGSDGTVAFRSKAQGPLVTIATSQPNATGTGMAIAAFGGRVYWAPRGLGNTDGLARSALPVANAAVTTYASARERPISIVSDGTFVYWTDLGNGTDGMVERSPVGSAAPVALATGLPEPLSIGLDGTVLYFTSLGNAATGAPGGLYRLVLPP